MQIDQPAKSRKRFLQWTAAILSSVALLKIFPRIGKQKNSPVNKTVKMLTRDGRLVEIDKRLVVSAGKKVTTEELQQWITNSHTK